MSTEKMTMKQAVVSVFRNYATFSGRARRSEYWWFIVFDLLVYFAIWLVGSAIGTSSSNYGNGLIFRLIVNILYALATIIPTLSLWCRRLHDIGKSGSYLFFILLPVVGHILLLVWATHDSDPNTNQYGPNPKLVSGVNSTSYKQYRRNTGTDTNKTPKPKNGEYIFITCKKCGSRLRLPGGRGRLQICCPICKYEFIANS